MGGLNSPLEEGIATCNKRNSSMAQQKKEDEPGTLPYPEGCHLADVAAVRGSPEPRVVAELQRNRPKGAATQSTTQEKQGSSNSSG